MITKNNMRLVYKSQPYTNKSKHSRFVSDDSDKKVDHFHKT
jgi:hypothetical protein